MNNLEERWTQPTLAAKEEVDSTSNGLLLVEVEETLEEVSLIMLLMMMTMMMIFTAKE